MSLDHRATGLALTPTPAVVACKICGTAAPCCGSVDFSRNCEARNGLVLPEHGTQIPYQRCPRCGFVFTSAFDAWQPDDFKRHIYNDDYLRVDPEYEAIRPMRVAVQIRHLFAGDKAALNVLDYGGGNGLLGRELVRHGFASAVTYDPFSEAYAELPTVEFDLVTCFETLEHVPDPLATIGRICSRLRPGGMVVFSTELQPDVFDLDWWYLAPRNGHISLFTPAALSAAWGKHGLRVMGWNSGMHAAYREVPDFAPVGLRTSLGLPAAPPREGGRNSLADCRGWTMLFDASDQFTGVSLSKYGEYLVGETEILGLLVQPGMTVVEIGAHIGARTLDLSRLVGPAGRVHAFEPRRLVFQLLCANLALNDCRNVFTHQAAIGVVVGDQGPLLTIDGLGLDACHVIKVDGKGTEVEAIRGGAATIGRFRPVLYVNSERAARSAELIGLLQSYGYRLYWHLPALFNAQNVRGERGNVFGGLVRVAMLGIPAEFEQDIDMLREITGPSDTWC